MKKEYQLKILKILGVAIMLIAFPIIPDHYPWYYEMVLFNTGLIFLLATKWNKLKKELGFTKSQTPQ